MIDEEIEFDRELAKKRHAEIAKTLQSISAALNRKGDDNISAELEKQCQKIEAFSEVIRNLPKPQSPQININQDQVINSIQTIGKDILKGLSDLQLAIAKPKEKTEWIFEVKRHSHSDLIQSVTAKQK